MWCKQPWQPSIYVIRTTNLPFIKLESIDMFMQKEIEHGPHMSHGNPRDKNSSVIQDWRCMISLLLDENPAIELTDMDGTNLVEQEQREERRQEHKTRRHLQS